METFTWPPAATRTWPLTGGDALVELVVQVAELSTTAALVVPLTLRRVRLPSPV
jgi:hypothetical protein